MKLAFLHIPKTGGVSVERAIARARPETRTCPLYFPDDFAGKGYDDVSGFELYQGHFDFDFVATLPAEYTRAVVVRPPLDHTLSLFNHIATRPRHALHHAVAVGGMSFADLLSENRALHNSLAKYLLGRRRYGEITHAPTPVRARIEAALEAAAMHLESFDVIGSTPRLEAFVRDLSAATGVELVPPRIENRNPSTVLRRADMTEADLEAFRAATWIDRPLYAMIRHRILGSTS